MMKYYLLLAAVWMVILGGIYGTVWIITHQPAIKIIREFNEREQAKLHLYEKVSYNYKQFIQLSNVVVCESRWMPLAFNAQTFDYGLFQINKMHLHEARSKGYDVIGNWRDNIDFAVDELHARSGLRPWYPSQHCWAHLAVK